MLARARDKHDDLAMQDDKERMEKTAEMARWTR